MHLPRTDEQRMLGESAQRFLGAQPRPVWADMARMGWVAAAFDEDSGGLAGGAADVAPLCEAFGAAGVALPYVSTVLLPAMLIRRLPGAGERRAEAATLMQGSRGIALAHQEGGGAFDPHSACATRADGAGRLTGSKRRVWDAGGAERLIVSAQTGAGLGLYMVEADAPACRLRDNGEATLPWADASFDATPARLLVAGAGARAALADAAAFAIVGVLAETLGLMTGAFEQTRAWLGARRQFGQALAANQVLRHRFTDMFIAIEESRSMLNLAIHAHDHAGVEDRLAALHAARVHIAQAARMVGQSAVHLHGAMGMTEELAAARAYRRIEALNAIFGGADHHLQRYVDLAFGASAPVR